MTTTSAINSNQTLGTTSNPTFASVNLTSPLSMANGGTGVNLSTANNSILATNGSGILGLTTSLPTAVQLNVNSFNSGSGASSSTFWRGDGTWATAGGAGSFVAPTIQKFLSGSGTYTTAASVLYIRVVMVGAGGGGGGSGSTGSTAGGTGGTTTFGSSLLTCTGGVGGTLVASGGSANGGTATLNSPAVGISMTGSQGEGASFNGTAFTVAGAAGAASVFGGAAAGLENNPGQSATANSGSGGAGGGSTGGGAGGGGGAGAYIDAIIYTPSATYAYSVGAAGAQGSPGTGGSSGGLGGSGAIYVYEYYQ